MPSYEEEIQKVFPKLSIKTSKIIETGWDCVVVEVNSDQIFRVPREKRDMTGDAKLLKFLEQKNLAVPHNVIVADDGSIMGYSKVNGEELEPPIFEKFDKTARRGAIDQIARFLTDLHAIDIHEAIAIGVEQKPANYLFDKVRTWINTHLAERLSDAELNRIEQFMDDWKSNIGGYTPCLVHCDFSSDHILYETAEGGEIKLGFIDFSDSIIHDPAWDFAKLLDYGELVFDEILQKYETKNDKQGIKKRAEVYRQRTYVWHLADPFLNLPHLPFDFETALKEFRDHMMQPEK